MAPIPITVFTGFLGAGKTTVIVSLTHQLPANYKLAILKNEFGNTEVDSALLRQSTSTTSSASSSPSAGASITAIRELANGCICCNLVGQMADGLEELRRTAQPDRIVIETSGSALPATLVLELNRLIAAEPVGRFVLDGVVTVIDVENWDGYADASPTARLQARYTDLIVLNKWEDASERRVDACLDQILGLVPDAPVTRTDHGFVSKDVLLGLDNRISRDGQFAALTTFEDEDDEDGDFRLPGYTLGGKEKAQHADEVDLVSVLVRPGMADYIEGDGIDLAAFHRLLAAAPRDEVFRIKAIVRTRQVPDLSGSGSPSEPASLAFSEPTVGSPPGLQSYALNWAFGRWRYVRLDREDRPGRLGVHKPHTQTGKTTDEFDVDPLLRMSVITAPGEGRRWRKWIEDRDYIVVKGDADGWDIVVTGSMH